LAVNLNIVLTTVQFGYRLVTGYHQVTKRQWLVCCTSWN